jgi:hypothetical protein
VTGAPLARAAVAILAIATACSSSGGAGPTVAPDAAPTTQDALAAPSMGPADPAAVIGAFDIRLVPDDPGSAMSPPTPAYVAIQGRVSSSPRPPLLTLEETAREGPCRIEVPSAPFCSSCRDGICIKGGICVPHPQPRSAGTVTIEGVKTIPATGPVRMGPQPPQFFYQPGGDVTIAFPPFAEGAPVRLQASGGDVPAFEIAGRGTTLLEVTTPTPLMMDRDKPLSLRWKAAGVAGISRVGIAVDISHHGGFKGQITCDADDSGAIEVPATLVSKLMDLGVAGYPTLTATRRSSAQAQLPTGRVELNIVAERILPIVITGYTSCGENDPCPPGKTCGQDGLCR